MTLGPQGLIFLTALVCAFGGLLFAVVRLPRNALKVPAGVLALVIGSVFGMALVNQHYAYYTSWGSLYDATTDRGAVSLDSLPTQRPSSPLGLGGPQASLTPRSQRSRAPSAGSSLSPQSSTTAKATTTRSAALSGLTAARYPGHGTVVKLKLAGATSGLNRQGYVYLPPQYSDPKYADTKFPVAELLHGDPGDPGSWIYGLSVANVLDSGINHGLIGPTIVVMPATYTGSRGQECIDAVVGDADETYLAIDVPADVMATFRVAAPGAAWAVGGLSDGGFCAANLALRHPLVFGAAAVMDGYFSPSAYGQHKQRLFGGDAARENANDPSVEVLDTARRLPHFWIMAGTRNNSDVNEAHSFARKVQAREPASILSVVGGDHTTPAWRTAMPVMLQWIWRVTTGRPVTNGDSSMPIQN